MHKTKYKRLFKLKKTPNNFSSVCQSETSKQPSSNTHKSQNFRYIWEFFTQYNKNIKEAADASVAIKWKN